MGKPGMIAFPVILALGAITGYITYNFFTAASPQEDRLDSPYYLPPPTSVGGNETSNAGGAVQTEGGPEEQVAVEDEAATTTGGVAGPTLIILEGSAVQGNPDYDPEELTVSVGDEITVVNEDTVPHTVTSGTGPQDETSGQAFDTGILDGEASATLSFADVAPGEYDYYCIVHPYMMGKITVQ
jgi:plastocyanin